MVRRKATEDLTKNCTKKISLRKQMLIFSVETSCDETAAAILSFDTNGKFKLLVNQVSSQIKIHAPWGGIVPNLAAREHSKNILPVINDTFKEADLTPEKMDLFCVANGPGLIPALLIGTNVVKTLSYFYQKPLIGVHHIEGHIYSNYLQKNQGNLNQFKFPILNLVISGGHTQLILMKDHLEYEIIGQTQDDAVGEAFDKVAKIMGFEYPGGPMISAQANEAEDLITVGDVDEKYLEIKFPRPMMHLPNLDFSFSGLKTAVLYFYQKLEAQKLPEKEMALWKKFISHAFQAAVVEVLQHKTLKAIEAHQPQTVLLSGGVSANNQIFETLEKKLTEEYPEIIFHSPEKIFCGDNAAMIGVAGIAQHLYGDKKKFKNNWRDLEANSNLKL
jgi:N6-L-threonylcarbamoyladenine synthase